MKTFTGRIIDPLNLRPEDIDIVDIAHHLSMECRFGGAVPYHYSVAQHSVYVAQEKTMCEPEPYVGFSCHARQKLLHDASEAYLRDIPRPIKHSRYFEGYRELEKQVQAIIFLRFNLPPEMPQCVHDADNRLLVREGIELMHERFPEYGYPSVLSIEPWTQEAAKKAFLNDYRRYFLNA